jgi:hypothetical protein
MKSEKVQVKSAGGQIYLSFSGQAHNMVCSNGEMLTTKYGLSWITRAISLFHYFIKGDPPVITPSYSNRHIMVQAWCG